MQFDRNGFLGFLRKNGYPNMTNWHPIMCCAVRIFDFNMLAGCTTWKEAAERFERKTKKYKGLTSKVAELLESYFLGTPVKQKRFEVATVSDVPLVATEEQALLCKQLVRSALLEIVCSEDKLGKELANATNKAQGLEVALQQSLENNKVLSVKNEQQAATIASCGKFIDRLCDKFGIRKDGEAQSLIMQEIDHLVEYKNTIALRLKSLTEVA